MSDVVCPQCEHPCAESHKFCPVCGFPIGEITSKVEDPLLGTTLPGGYVILELVGVGGMGRVYRAEQKALGRTVAVKIIHPHLLGDESASARFITEARAASRLNHPNSVGVIDFGKSAGQLYLVMEFLRGRDLARVMYEDGYLPFPRIIDVLVQVLAALDEAHHLQIIHRDLKPENIVLEPMRSGGDFVKVVDFGLAKMRDLMSTSITTPGLVCGTPDYMAPEQGRGDPIDARSDLYACGVILFQLLTGRLPYEADSPTQVVLMHISSAIPDPRKIAPEREIPDILAEIVNKALAKSADDRFLNAEDYSGALKGAMSIIDRVSLPSIIQTEGVRCASCSAVVPLGQKFCGECGARVVPLPLGSQPPRRMSDPKSDGVRLPLPFRGREDDLDWLDVCRFEVQSSLITARIIGDHGVGKSRLVDEFLRSAAQEGDIVSRTTPDPWWSEVGYYALRHAIIALAELPDNGGTPADWAMSSPEARRGLEEIFAQTQSRFSPPPHSWEPDSTEISSQNRRFMTAEALRWAIAKANHQAGRNRVILAIDDLQAVDGPSRLAFLDVVQEPPLVGMLVVATHLPDFDPGWGGSTRVLSGLPLDIAASLVKGTKVQKGTDKTISPMYIDQLVRFGLDTGGLEAESHDPPPTRLGDLIARRIERLPPEARRTLQGIAVLGDETHLDVLAEVLDAVGSVDAAVDTLARGGFIERRGAIVGTQHPFIREVMLAMIPAGVKKDLHARAYTDTAGDTRRLPTEVLALHAYAAQSSFEALMLLETVANRTMARGDVNGSVLALRRALDLARREMSRGEIDDPERAVLIFSRRLGEALARAGSLTDANGVLNEALDMAGHSGPDRVQVLGTLAFIARQRSRPTEAQRHLNEALTLAKDALMVDLVDSLERARKEWRLT